MPEIQFQNWTLPAAFMLETDLPPEMVNGLNKYLGVKIMVSQLFLIQNHLTLEFMLDLTITFNMIAKNFRKSWMI